MAKKIAAIIFLLVGLAHLSRVRYPFELIIGGWPFPPRFSIIVGCLVVALGIWLWRSKRESRFPCPNKILTVLISLVTLLLPAAFGFWISVIWRADNPPLNLTLQAQPSGEGLQFDIFNWGQSPADGVCLSWSYLNNISTLAKSDVKAQYPYLGSVFPSFSSAPVMGKFTKTVAPNIIGERKFDAVVAVLGQESSLPFAPAGLINRVFVFLTEDGAPYKFKSSLEDLDLTNIYKIRNCISVYRNCKWEFTCNLDVYDRVKNHFNEIFVFSKH